MQEVGQEPPIVLAVQSSLDSSNCQRLVDQAREIHQMGGFKLIIDLQHTNTLSTTGLQALQTIVLLFKEKPRPTGILPEFLTSCVHIHNPQPHIAQALLLLGFGDFAEIQYSA